MTNSVETAGPARPPKLLAGFARDDRRQLLAGGRAVELAEHETFMHEGDRDLNLYLVLTGYVSVWRGDVQVATLGAGEVLNETKMFLPRPNQHSARAEIEGTTLLRLPRVELLSYFRDQPERLLKVFVLNIVAILAQRVEDREESMLSGLIGAVAADAGMHHASG